VGAAASISVLRQHCSAAGIGMRMSSRGVAALRLFVDQICVWRCTVLLLMCSAVDVHTDVLAAPSMGAPCWLQTKSSLDPEDLLVHAVHACHAVLCTGMQT
jgi:hypothetical protein